MFSKATAKIWIAFIFTLVVLFSMTGTYAWFFREQLIISEENELYVTSTSMTIIDLNVESGADGTIKPAVLKRGVLASGGNITSNDIFVGEDLGKSNEKYFDELAVSTKQRVELTIIGGDAASGWMFISCDYNLLFTQDKVSENPKFERINKNVLGLKMKRIFYISEVFNNEKNEYEKVTEESLFFRNPYSTYTTRHLEFEIWFQQADEILDPKFKDALFKIEIIVLAVQVSNINEANLAFKTGVNANFSYDNETELYATSAASVGTRNESSLDGSIYKETTTTKEYYLAPTSCATVFDVLDMYKNGYASIYQTEYPNIGFKLPNKKYTATLLRDSSDPEYALNPIFTDVCPLTLYVIEKVHIDYYVRETIIVPGTPPEEPLEDEEEIPDEIIHIDTFSHSVESVKIVSVSTDYKTWAELEAMKD